MEKWTRLLIIITTLLLMLTFVGVVILLGTYIQHTLLLFSLGALIAYALDPLVEWLRRASLTRSRRVPSREMSVTVVFLAMFLLFGLAAWSLGGHLVSQVAAIEHEYPRYHQRALERAAAADRFLHTHGVRYSLVDTLQHPPPELNATLARYGGEALPFLKDFFSKIAESLIVLLIALYFLLFGAEMREKFNALLPEKLRERADLWETDVSRILGAFVRGQLIIALVMGAAAAIGCLLLGLKLWLLIGLFVVVASLIPVFGPYIGAIPAVIAALIGPTHLHNSVLAAIVLVVYFVLINEVGSKVLYPKLVGAALGLHTVLVLFVLFAGLEISGLVGVLFAAPLTALVIVSIVHLYRLWQDLPDSLLSTVAQSESRKPETHDQINHPQA